MLSLPYSYQRYQERFVKEERTGLAISGRRLDGDKYQLPPTGGALSLLNLFSYWTQLITHFLPFSPIAQESSPPSSALPSPAPFWEAPCSNNPSLVSLSFSFPSFHRMAEGSRVLTKRRDGSGAREKPNPRKAAMKSHGKRKAKMIAQEEPDPNVPRHVLQHREAQRRYKLRKKVGGRRREGKRGVLLRPGSMRMMIVMMMTLTTQCLLSCPLLCVFVGDGQAARQRAEAQSTLLNVV